tara:strand:- start:1818 stop:2060 length:243 start_codon:yes stop_codon:yes gene_type:complete
MDIDKIYWYLLDNKWIIWTIIILIIVTGSLVIAYFGFKFVVGLPDTAKPNTDFLRDLIKIGMVAMTGFLVYFIFRSKSED